MSQKFVKIVANFHEKLSKIRDIEKCRTCICFYETLKFFDDEVSRVGIDEPERTLDSSSWWKEKERMEIHDCLGCEPCLPVEAYSEFQKSLGKKAYCPVCDEEIK